MAKLKGSLVHVMVSGWEETRLDSEVGFPISASWIRSRGIREVGISQRGWAVSVMWMCTRPPSSYLQVNKQWLLEFCSKFSKYFFRKVHNYDLISLRQVKFRFGELVPGSEFEVFQIRSVCFAPADDLQVAYNAASVGQFTDFGYTVSITEVLDSIHHWNDH